MRKINDRAVFIILVMLFYLVTSFFLIDNGFSVLYTNVINPIFWLIVFLFSFLMFKNDSVNKKRKFDILQRVIVVLISFFIIYFLFGLLIGFVKMPYSRNIFVVIKNVIKYGIVIIFQEYVRKGLINRSGNNKKIIVIITALLILFDILENLLIYSFNGSQSIFEYIVTYLNPAIAMHLLLTYLTYHSDYFPSLVYRFVLTTYFFIVPFIPNFGWFLNGTINLFLPFITYLVVSSYINEKEKNINQKNKKNYKRILINVCLSLVLMILIALVSGKAKYQLLAVGSNSMNPTFYRGDAVLIKRITKKEIIDINENDIIVFYNDDILTVHRVMEKIEIANDKFVYKTKGDANNAYDNKVVEPNHIVAKYVYRIPKIGYPTVYVQEKIFKE